MKVSKLSVQFPERDLRRGDFTQVASYSWGSVHESKQSDSGGGTAVKSLDPLSAPVSGVTSLSTAVLGSSSYDTKSILNTVVPFCRLAGRQEVFNEGSMLTLNEKKRIEVRNEERSTGGTTSETDTYISVECKNAEMFLEPAIYVCVDATSGGSTGSVGTRVACIHTSLAPIYKEDSYSAQLTAEMYYSSVGMYSQRGAGDKSAGNIKGFEKSSSVSCCAVEPMLNLPNLARNMIDASNAHATNNKKSLSRVRTIGATTKAVTQSSISNHTGGHDMCVGGDTPLYYKPPKPQEDEEIDTVSGGSYCQLFKIGSTDRYADMEFSVRKLLWRNSIEALEELVPDDTLGDISSVRVEYLGEIDTESVKERLMGGGLRSPPTKNQAKTTVEKKIDGMEKKIDQKLLSGLAFLKQSNFSATVWDEVLCYLIEGSTKNGSCNVYYTETECSNSGSGGATETETERLTEIETETSSGAGSKRSPPSSVASRSPPVTAPPSEYLTAVKSNDTLIPWPRPSLTKEDRLEGISECTTATSSSRISSLMGNDTFQIRLYATDVASGSNESKRTAKKVKTLDDVFQDGFWCEGPVSSSYMKEIPSAFSAVHLLCKNRLFSYYLC